MKNFDINNLVRENVKQLKPYSSARDEFEDFDTADMVFLDANENPFQSGVNRYPDPQQSNVKVVLAKSGTSRFGATPILFFTKGRFTTKFVKLGKRLPN